MSREQRIEGYIRGRDVLDVGPVDEDGGHSLWNFLHKHARSLTGIDLRPSSDPDVTAGNMETQQFGRSFDVIIAGDVLIQTDNQGLFLDNCSRHLKEGGRLILTLPNAKWPTVYLRPSRYQTGWHDRYTLVQLLTRHGWAVDRLDFYPGNRHTMTILRNIIGFRQAMFVVCRKDTSNKA